MLYCNNNVLHVRHVSFQLSFVRCEAMADQTIQIKRYPNRRFYDRNASKYISLEQIESLVRSGEKVEIRDSQSGEEITRSVLTRIILERQPEKMRLFPPDMLHFILRANEVSTSFLRDYFQHSVTYLDYLAQHGAGASQLAKPMHWMKAWLDGIAPKQAEEEVSPPEENGAPVDATDPLMLRVQQLEQRLAQLESEKN